MKFVWPALSAIDPATVPEIKVAIDVTGGYAAGKFNLTGSTINSFTSQDSGATVFAPGASLTKPTLSSTTNNGKAFNIVQHSDSVDTDGLYGTITIAQPCHQIIVARLSTIHASNDQFFFDGIGGSNRNALLRQNSSLSYFGLAGTNFTAVYTDDPAYWTPNTSWHILEFIADGARSIICLDGAFLMNDAGAQTLTGVTIGNRFQGGGSTRGQHVQWGAYYAFGLNHHWTYGPRMRAYLANRFGITLLSDGRL